MLEGLEISEVSLSALEFSSRLDSEYYRPSLLEYERIISSQSNSNLSELSDFLIGPFGSAFTVDKYTNVEDYRYIRGKDVKPLKLKDDDNVFMPEEDYYRLEKYALRENDILVTVVGTLGNAALVTKKDLPAIFSCKSTVLRPFNINPVYLLTYINSKYGRELLLRKERGAIQKGFNLGDLENLEIFLPSEDFQLKIENLFKKSFSNTERSKALYSEAETLLLKEIGLNEFTPNTDGINIKSLSSSFATSGRLDAEYYQPKYDDVMEKVISQPYDLLSNIVSIKKSIEPGSKNYVDEDGLPFMRVADYSKFGMTVPQKSLSQEYVKENQKKINKLKPKAGTILFSKDGSVGTAYHLRKDFEGITSGAILHLNVKDKNKIIPEYLTLALNSQVVQMQAERDAGGSIILHWRLSEIENVVVPIIDLDIQKQIAALIEESFALKKQSEQLLETAKRAVETAIEQDEASALKLIDNE